MARDAPVSWSGGDTRDTRLQAERRGAALRLLRRDDVRLTLLPDRRVRVLGDAPPEVVAEVRAVRAELAELLEGHRCLACGEPLAHMTRLPCGAGWVHRSRCSGYPRRPVSTQVARK